MEPTVFREAKLLLRLMILPFIFCLKLCNYNFKRFKVPLNKGKVSFKIPDCP